jgi:DNA replication protein DnaD
MARPKKEGLDYFPLDVDMDQDDKIALIEAKHGLIGFSIVVKLLMKIYKNSYFYKWSEKEHLLFSSRINADINSISEVINDCINWGLFDEKNYKNYSILTSKGIQERYVEAISRRKEVVFIEEYLMINPVEHIGNSRIKIKIINSNKNLINVDINPNNDNDNPQSKSNSESNSESKEKEIKKEEVKEAKSRPNLNDGFRSSFNYEPSPNQIDFLSSYIDQDGMEEDLVLWVIKETGILGKDFAYAKGWLNRAVSKGILTLSDAIKANEEHERKKQQSQANSNVRPFRQPNGPVREAPDWLKENGTSRPEVNLNPRTEEENAQWLEELLKGKGGS